MSKGKVVVLVTCGTASEAERISRELVNLRLAACVNLLESPVRSIYRWNGKIENAPEYLLIIKTGRKQLTDVQAAVERLHSYGIPEIISLSITAGSTKYLNWLAENLREDSMAPPMPKRVSSARPAAVKVEKMKPLDLLPGELKK